MKNLGEKIYSRLYLFVRLPRDLRTERWFVYKRERDEILVLDWVELGKAEVITGPSKVSARPFWRPRNFGEERRGWILAMIHSCKVGYGLGKVSPIPKAVGRRSGYGGEAFCKPGLNGGTLWTVEDYSLQPVEYYFGLFHAAARRHSWQQASNVSSPFCPEEATGASSPLRILTGWERSLSETLLPPFPTARRPIKDAAFHFVYKLPESDLALGLKERFEWNISSRENWLNMNSCLWLFVSSNQPIDFWITPL